MISVDFWINFQKFNFFSETFKKNPQSSSRLVFKCFGEKNPFGTFNFICYPFCLTFVSKLFFVKNQNYFCQNKKYLTVAVGEKKKMLFPLFTCSSFSSRFVGNDTVVTLSPFKKERLTMFIEKGKKGILTLSCNTQSMSFAVFGISDNHPYCPIIFNSYRGETYENFIETYIYILVQQYTFIITMDMTRTFRSLWP